MILMIIISAVLAVLLNHLAKKNNVKPLLPIIGAIAGYIVFMVIVYFVTKDRIKVRSWDDYGEAVLLNIAVAFISHGIGAVGAYFAARWWILKQASEAKEKPVAPGGGITVDSPEVKQAYREAEKQAPQEEPKEPGEEKKT